MRNSFYFLLAILLFSAVLAACSAETESVTQELEEIGPTAVMEMLAGEGGALSTDYPDALPPEMQLAIGTLQLENTNLAVSAEQAQTLLPYWRVLQSLNQSDNTADAELNAVIKQIQEGMSGEQIAAIAAMEFTEEKLQTMLDDGSINFEYGRGQSGSEAGSGSGFRPGGGPGGGFPGGPPGGGPGGGLPDGFGGDPGALATRQAEMAAGDGDPTTAMMERLSSNMVIRLLETKTGATPQRGFGGMGAVMSVAGELSGLSQEELGQAMAEGQTLGEILVANGVSIEEARTAMIEALANTQLPEGADPESWVDNLLSGAPSLSLDAGSQP
jgi:hypothetical protein